MSEWEKGQEGQLRHNSITSHQAWVSGRESAGAGGRDGSWRYNRREICHLVTVIMPHLPQCRLVHPTLRQPLCDVSKCQAARHICWVLRADTQTHPLMTLMPPAWALVCPSLLDLESLPRLTRLCFGCLLLCCCGVHGCTAPLAVGRAACWVKGGGA